MTLDWHEQDPGSPSYPLPMDQAVPGISDLEVIAQPGIGGKYGPFEQVILLTNPHVRIKKGSVG